MPSATGRSWRLLLAGSCSAAALATLPNSAIAQSPDRLAELERQIALLSAEVQELKAAQAAAPAPS